MEFKLGSYKNSWSDLNIPDNASEDAKNTNDEDKRRLNQFIVDILLSENLVVLAGLGTSLSAHTNVTLVGSTYPAPKMSTLWNAVKNKDPDIFKKIITKTKYSIEKDGENIELFLSRCKLFQKIEDSSELKNFLEIAEKEILTLCDFVTEDLILETHEMFLRKVARRGPRLPRTQFFTTNYDLCFEQAAARTRFILNDGFSYTNPPEFDGQYFNYDIVNRGNFTDHTHPEFVANLFQLHKLHGSIDWEEKNGQIYKTSNRINPCIIYPQDGKYESSYSAPYLELMSRFQTSLRKQNLGLLIIGFGFNDNHITHPIIQSLKSNVHSKILIIDPSIKSSSNAHLKTIEKLCDSGDWRIGLISGTFEDFVKILPDILKESEFDGHYNRVKGIK